MKTSKLSGAALDWAVAKCEGKFNEDGDYWADPEGIWYFLTARNNPSEGLPWTNGSTDWAQGGPIIEREQIAMWPDEEGGFFASANEGTGVDYHGETYLIAAMRCYVASKLGDEVEIPNELMEAA